MHVDEDRVVYVWYIGENVVGFAIVFTIYGGGGRYVL